MNDGIKTTISDKQLSDLKHRVGEVIRPPYEEWQLADARVTRSTIRTWAVLNADMRPLYMDPEYARSSPWKTIIAPPAIIIAQEQLDPEISAVPGAFSTLASAQLSFEQPIRLNDTILSESKISAVEDISKVKVPGRVVSVVVDTHIQTQDKRPIGQVVLDWHLVERGSAAQRALFGDREDAHMYSQQDIEALGAEYKLEKQRAADPLYWEDVAEGDELQYVLKGPTTRAKHIGRTDSIWYWGHKQGCEEMEQHPERFFRNENGALEPVMAVDWVHHRAQRWGGLPGALEVNSDRPHYIVQALSNWMGDAGFPHQMQLEFPVQNMIGDVTRSYGRVTAKRKQGKLAIVQLDVWQKNQLEQTITTGTADVILPTR